MREAIGGTWIFQIVIVFILLFTGFMCLSINRSKAFSVKDKIIQTLQSYNGVNEEAITDIVDYIKENSYRTTGVYPDEITNGACYNRNGEQVTSNPVFCIEPYNVKDVACSEGGTCFNELPDMYYYRVIVFYQLDLPIFHDLFNFKMVGDTKTMYKNGGSGIWDKP